MLCLPFFSFLHRNRYWSYPEHVSPVYTGCLASRWLAFLVHKCFGSRGATPRHFSLMQGLHYLSSIDLLFALVVLTKWQFLGFILQGGESIYCLWEGEYIEYLVPWRTIVISDIHKMISGLVHFLIGCPFAVRQDCKACFGWWTMNRSVWAATLRASVWFATIFSPSVPVTGNFPDSGWYNILGCRGRELKRAPDVLWWTCIKS